jgi:hypothetical protein
MNRQVDPLKSLLPIKAGTWMKTSRYPRLSRLCILLIVTLSLTACQVLKPSPTPIPISAEEILEQSQQAMQQAQSFKVDLSLIIAAEALQVDVQGSMAVEQPGRMLLAFSAGGQNFYEEFTDGEATYIKTAGTTGWTRQTAGNTDQVAADMNGLTLMLIMLVMKPPEKAQGSNNMEQLDQWNLSEFASSDILVSEETVNGAPAYLLEFEIDLGAYLSRYPEIAELFTNQPATGTAKVWISQATSTLEQLALEMEVTLDDQPVTFNIDLSFEGYNQPVDFPEVE